MQSPPFHRYLIPPRSKYSPEHHILKHPQLPFHPQCQRPGFTPRQNNRENLQIVLSFSLSFVCWWKNCFFDKFLHWINTGLYGIIMLLIWKYSNFECYCMLCRRSLRNEIVLVEVSTELSKLCDGSFVAKRPRRAGLRPIVTGILSRLIYERRNWTDYCGRHS